MFLMFYARARSASEVYVFYITTFPKCMHFSLFFLTGIGCLLLVGHQFVFNGRYYFLHVDIDDENLKSSIEPKFRETMSDDSLSQFLFCLCLEFLFVQYMHVILCLCACLCTCIRVPSAGVPSGAPV